MVTDDDGSKSSKKRKRQSGGAKDLQQQKDILSQILTRLGVKSLMRFKLACKSWMAFISDPFFVDSHSHRNKSNPPEIVTIKVWRDYVVLVDGKGRQKSCFSLISTKDRNLKFILNPTFVHYNGLFLIGRTARRLVVCNPATREVVALPPATHVTNVMESGVGIGLDHSTNKYKVVRIFERWSYNRKHVLCGIEVITLGAAGNPWRLKTYPPYDISGDLDADRTMVTVQGAVYWKIIKKRDNDYNSTSDSAILRFDLSNEEFTVIDPPDPNKYVHLAELQGHLYCYAHDAPDEGDATIWVWLLNDNLVGWKCCYTIHLQGPVPMSGFMPIAIDQEGCMLFKSPPRNLHCYNPRTNQFYGMGDAYALDSRGVCFDCHTTSYVETIMPISSDR